MLGDLFSQGVVPLNLFDENTASGQWQTDWSPGSFKRKWWKGGALLCL